MTKKYQIKMVKNVNSNETRVNKCDFHDDMKETVQDHEIRIRGLEITGSARDEKIDGLCDKISDLITAIKWLIGAGSTALGGFFIWYIQSLPR